MNIEKDTIPIIHWNDCSIIEQTNMLTRPKHKNITHLHEKVANIIKQVSLYGDDALKKFNLDFDNIHTTQLNVPLKKILNAKNYLSNIVKHSINYAKKNITRFHQLQKFPNIDVEIVSGVRCKQIIRPLNIVGLYVPGGITPLPSTVMMLGVPAHIAQCKRVILCSPPPISNEILYTAQLCGIKEIYQVGGCQAIAAMGLGTKSIPKVEKIFGPGNIWVTEAKHQINCSNHGVAIDMIAGPSEILIIADHTANPIFIAADLLAQAEHGPDSQVILVTPNIDIAKKTKIELYKQLKNLSRHNIIAQSLINSRIIITNNIMECFSISNSYAPEHLIIQIKNAKNSLQYIYNAGSIFLGNWSPGSAGDYASGPNHVLPTYGHASTFSGLKVMDFQKYISVQELTPHGLLKLSTTIQTLANIEQLQAHKQSITYRITHINREKDEYS